VVGVQSNPRKSGMAFRLASVTCHLGRSGEPIGVSVRMPRGADRAGRTGTAAVKIGCASTANCGNNVRMLVRRECPDDIDAIRTVTCRAFDGMPYSSSSESRLVDALRSDPGWIPALSLVADVDRAVVGHVVCTRGTVAGRPSGSGR
jgi:hypothetical protein